MLCPQPLSLQTGVSVPCGRCMNCLVNQRRKKTARILLERRAWQRVGQNDAMFVTLTYDPEKLPLTVPEEEWDYGLVKAGKQRMPRPTLVRAHLQKYWKKLRKHWSDRVISYVGVGEYGDRKGRPHYHAVVFNVGPDDEPVLVQKWEHGFVQADELTKERAAYLAGYTTKKMTSERKRELEPAIPEFSVWSLKPAIGKKYVPYMVDSLDKYPEIVRQWADVNLTWRYGGEIWPLDRNFRTWMRAEWNARQTEHGYIIPNEWQERDSTRTRPLVPQKELTLEDEVRISNQAFRPPRPRKGSVF